MTRPDMITVLREAQEAGAAEIVYDGMRVTGIQNIAAMPAKAVLRQGHVYVIGFEKYAKIGWSAKYVRRVNELQTTLPAELKIYALLPGTFSLERELHRRFAAYRTRGEWFRVEGELADWISGECRL